MRAHKQKFVHAGRVFVRCAVPITTRNGNQPKTREGARRTPCPLYLKISLQTVIRPQQRNILHIFVRIPGRVRETPVSLFFFFPWCADACRMMSVPRCDNAVRSSERTSNRDGTCRPMFLVELYTIDTRNCRDSTVP